MIEQLKLQGPTNEASLMIQLPITCKSYVSFLGSHCSLKSSFDANYSVTYDSITCKSIVRFILGKPMCCSIVVLTIPSLMI